ncbi:MAG TPA: hypothetical protein VLL52_11535, partial [Anaerolineae bacterium]|nr:hypothetical protein [Anaerolineae bacterium]
MQKWLVGGWIVLCVGWYVGVTGWHLADFPLWEAAQAGLVAPAYKLATEGVYGNDLYAGWYRTELRNYEYLPLF